MDAAVFHSFDGGLGQGLGIGEPLVCEHRLDDQAGAVTAGHAQYVVFVVLDQAFGFHVCHDLLAGGLASQASVGGRQGAVDVSVLGTIRVEHFGDVPDVGILGHHVDHGQVVALAYGVVVEIVGRGDLHAAGAFFRVGVVVGHDGDPAVYQWQQYMLTDQVLVALVVRVHGHGRVAQHGRSEERRVGKSVDLGGRGIIKRKTSW